MLDFYSDAPSTEKNYKVTIDKEKGKMIIEIDLTKDSYPLTKSEKSLSVASSHGFDNIENTSFQLSLNVTAKLPK